VKKSIVPDGTGRPSLLVVDDLQTNRELLEAILWKEGCAVKTAGGGAEALRLLEEENFDLAVLDVMMPGMNGFELCEKMKNWHQPRFFPIILVTALQDVDSKIKGLESGADDFISKPFNTLELTTRIRSLLRLKTMHDELDHSEDIIITLALALEAKDAYTKGHSERVGMLAERLAAFIGLKDRDCLLLKKAGFLHDIGKIGVRGDILAKPGPINDAERSSMERHPALGAEICAPLNSLRNALPIVRHHHERWDGTGFPDGLAGEAIPLLARVLSVADAYDAMVSERPYRDSLTSEAALERLANERDSGQWDPQIVDAFLAMFRYAPPP